MLVLKTLKAALIALCLLYIFPASANQIVLLGTGNGSPGEFSDLTFLLGPADGPFSAPFTEADFQAARAGSNAPYTNQNAFWSPGTTFGADWVSTRSFQNFQAPNNGASALFALDFFLVDNVFTSATLTLLGGVDNALGSDPSFPDSLLPGGGSVAGLYLNGTPLPGSTFLQGGIFSAAPFTFTSSDIAHLLVTGTNTLYLYLVDTGGPSGLAFSGQLDVVGTTVVPLPGTVWLFGAGVFALMGLKRRAS